MEDVFAIVADSLFNPVVAEWDAEAAIRAALAATENVGDESMGALEKVDLPVLARV